MQAVHVLEPHEAQRDAPPLRDLLRGELDDLRGLGLLRVLGVAEAQRRPVDEELDEPRLLLRDAALDEDRPDAHELVELAQERRSGVRGAAIQWGGDLSTLR